MQSESLLIEFNDPKTVAYQLSLPRDLVPTALSQAGVTLAEWRAIWDSINTQWAPQLQKSYTIDIHVVENLQNYQTNTFWSETVYGEWGDNGVEKKVSKQILTSSHALAGVSMKANNSLALANFYLNRRGILAQLETDNQRYFEISDSVFGQKDYFRDADFFKPVGITFLVPMSYQDERETVAASVVRPSETTTATTTTTAPSSTRTMDTTTTATPYSPPRTTKKKQAISKPRPPERSPVDPNTIYDTKPRNVNRKLPQKSPADSWRNLAHGKPTIGRFRVAQQKRHRDQSGWSRMKL